jgi:hypothetical protein
MFIQSNWDVPAGWPVGYGRMNQGAPGIPTAMLPRML